MSNFVITVLFLVVIVLLLRRRVSGFNPFNPALESPMLVPDVLTPAECQCVIRSDDCPAIKNVVRTAAKCAGKPIENCEPPLILTNDQGGDAPGCEANDSCGEFENLGGKRIGCLVVYLNDNFEGGELRFDAHGGRRYRPVPGGGVYFRPLLSNRNAHKGEPVKNGTKYTCVVFVRENHADKIEVL
jgi:hypothetical protein